MTDILRPLLLVLAFLIGGPALAQDSRAWFGAEMRDLTKAEADRLGLVSGAVVAKAPELGSPAEKAGLVAGDVIITVDRMQVDTAAEFTAAVEAKKPGSELRLQVFSGGRQRIVTAKLIERPGLVVVQANEVPRLMLDTGGHMGLVKGLAFTPDGKHIVSTGADKTIRVWDWQAGKTVRFIRGQSDAGPEGMVYTAALSPDGRWYAVGGWMTLPGEVGHVVRIYDLASGNLVALLKGHQDVVLSVAFSPDSQRLISGSADRTAIIWDIRSRRSIYRLQGHRDAVYAVHFIPDGMRVVTGSDDRTLRLWRVNDGTLITELPGHAGRLSALTVRSSDGMIASGDTAGEIRLWDGSTGRFLRTLGSQAGEVGALVFSPDGGRLLSTCGGGTVSCASQPQIVWDVASGARVAEPKFHTNIAVAAAATPYGRLFATAGGVDFKIQVWGVDTPEAKQALAGKGTTSWAVGLSDDDRWMSWGTTWRAPTPEASNPLEFQMRLPSSGVVLGRPEAVREDIARRLLRTRVTAGPYSIIHRQGGQPVARWGALDVKKDGQTQVSIELTSISGYQHLSYTFTPDGQAIISGAGGGTLAAYDLKGNRIGNFVGHEGDVMSVTVSADGKLLISGSSDQTVRIWNLKTRELIATLFRGGDGEWVMWTPQGYYTGSPGADKIVGWQINKGPEQAADYVGADQLRTHLHRPDIVEKAIILASAERAVRESPGTAFKLADLLKRPVPRFRIVSPAAGSTVKGGRSIIKVDVEEVPDPIKLVRIQVNGRQVSEITPDMGFKGAQEFDVPLARGKNEVRVILSNNVGDRTETATLVHDGEGDLDKRGTLYILAVGVDRYPGLGKTCGPNADASCDLRYSGKDAVKLVETIEKRLGPAHTKVVKKVLVNGGKPDEAPTAANIIDATDMLRQANETDTIVMFIAGHGVNDGPDYRFLATNAERVGEAYRNVTVVPWQFLQGAMEAAKGRRIMFLDTCHSGNAYNQRLGNSAYHANIIAYTAARYDQTALEDSLLGHGLFTYAVVEALQGQGQPATKREISTKDLADYVLSRVNQLAKGMKGEQEPQYFKARDAEDYVLVRW